MVRLLKAGFVSPKHRVKGMQEEIDLKEGEIRIEEAER